MKEEWKPIRGYENRYEVSNFGRVKSLPKYHGSILFPEKILVGANDKDGYCVVTLRNSDGDSKTFKRHRLVADAFIPNPLNKTQVNHKDTNKSNNCVANLEWNTCKENIDHAIDHGLRNFHYQSICVTVTEKRTGENHRFSSLKDASLFMGHAKQYVCKMKRKHGNRFEVGDFSVEV